MIYAEKMTFLCLWAFLMMDKKTLSWSVNGKNTTLQIMICEFLIEIFDEEEILDIFTEFTKRRKKSH